MTIKIEKMTEIPVEYLVCPLTKRPLLLDGYYLVSPDGQCYQKVDNLYWSFIPAIDTTNDAKWRMWQELQKNGEASYQNDPENNLGIKRRDDHIAFGVCPDIDITLAVLSRRVGDIFISSRNPDYSWGKLFDSPFEVDEDFCIAPGLKSDPWSKFKWALC